MYSSLNAVPPWTVPAEVEGRLAARLEIWRSSSWSGLARWAETRSR